MRHANPNTAIDDAREAPRHHHAPTATQRRDQPTARHGPARGLLPAGREWALCAYGTAARRSRQI